MKSVLKIALGVVLGMILLFAGCTAIVGSALSSEEGQSIVEDSIQDAQDLSDGGSTSVDSGDDSGNDSGSEAGESTTEVAKGKKKASVGDFRVTGLQVTDDGLGDFALRFRAENTSDSPSIAFFSATLLRNDRIVGTADCAGGGANEIAPGSTTTVECVSLDKFTEKYDDVQIEHLGF